MLNPPRDDALGGKPFSRGTLYNILSNPIYLGELTRELRKVELGFGSCFVRCRSVERVAACKRQTIDRSPSTNDPALMR